MGGQRGLVGVSNFESQGGFRSSVLVHLAPYSRVFCFQYSTIDKRENFERGEVIDKNIESGFDVGFQVQAGSQFFGQLGHVDFHQRFHRSAVFRARSEHQVLLRFQVPGFCVQLEALGCLMEKRMDN